VICSATARNVASDIAFGFYRCGVPAGQSRVICAAIPRSSGSCQYQGRSSRFVRMARNTSPLTQTHVSRFYLKRIDDSRTSDSRGRSVGRSVEHAANDFHGFADSAEELELKSSPQGWRSAPDYEIHLPRDSATGDTGVSGSGTSARHGPRRTGRCRDGHENPADCSGDRTDRPADHCSHRTGVSVDVDDEAARIRVARRALT
jgi:hypothetical protein